MLDFEFENCYGFIEHIQLTDEECYKRYNKMINRNPSVCDVISSNFNYCKAEQQYVELRVFNYIIEKEKQTTEYWQKILTELEFLLKTRKNIKEKYDIELQIKQVKNKMNILKFKKNRK